MSFGEVQTGFGQLRRRIAVYVGSEALPDITIDPPKGIDDELSFIRLVAWAYVLLFEVGRVPLGYLRQLPPWNQPASALLPYVRALRTWSSHNLALDKEADLVTLRSAVEWFSRTCGAGTPAKDTHWNNCFLSLCGDLVTLLSNAVSACDAFEDQADRERLVDGLKHRIDRNWAAFRFDSIIETTLDGFGYRGIDIVRFRGGHLDSWRKLVANSLEDEIERNLKLRIEADVLALMNNALPLTSEELVALTGAMERDALISLLQTLRNSPAAKRSELVSVLRGSI